MSTLHPDLTPDVDLLAEPGTGPVRSGRPAGSQRCRGSGPASSRGSRRLAGRTEEDLYQALGLNYIPPELREDRGEIEAAGRDALPQLIERPDLKGDLHVHTNASDGMDTLERMVAAVHDHFGLSETRQTMRSLRSLERPCVSILAHPSGRPIGERHPYAFDFEKVLDGMSERGRCLEVNGQPSRLDMDDGHIKAAVERGVPLSIASDAHSVDQLADLDGAVRQARRGWARRQRMCSTRAPCPGCARCCAGDRPDAPGWPQRWL